MGGSHGRHSWEAPVRGTRGRHPWEAPVGGTRVRHPWEASGREQWEENLIKRICSKSFLSFNMRIICFDLQYHEGCRGQIHPSEAEYCMKYRDSEIPSTLFFTRYIICSFGINSKPFDFKMMSPFKTGHYNS